jgi:hypothetical protein
LSRFRELISRFEPRPDLGEAKGALRAAVEEDLELARPLLDSDSVESVVLARDVAAYCQGAMAEVNVRVQRRLGELDVVIRQTDEKIAELQRAQEK